MDPGAVRQSRHRPAGGWFRHDVWRSPPSRWYCVPSSASARSYSHSFSSFRPLGLSILTLGLRQPMHPLLLESADDGLDGREFLLVLVDPVRAAGSGPEINLFDEVSLLTLELRQEIGGSDVVVAGKAGDLDERALHLQRLETIARLHASRVKVPADVSQLQLVSGDELVRVDWLWPGGRDVHRSTCHRLFPLFAHGVFAHPCVHERHLRAQVCKTMLHVTHTHTVVDIERSPSARCMALPRRSRSWRIWIWTATTRSTRRAPISFGGWDGRASPPRPTSVRQRWRQPKLSGISSGAAVAHRADWHYGKPFVRSRSDQSGGNDTAHQSQQSPCIASRAVR